MTIVAYRIVLVQIQPRRQGLIDVDLADGERTFSEKNFGRLIVASVDARMQNCTGQTIVVDFPSHRCVEDDSEIPLVGNQLDERDNVRQRDERHKSDLTGLHVLPVIVEPRC